MPKRFTRKMTAECFRAGLRWVEVGFKETAKRPKELIAIAAVIEAWVEREV